MINVYTKQAIKMMIGLCIALYLLAVYYADQGYGYMGYEGYTAEPSSWYFGGPKIYPRSKLRVGRGVSSRVIGGGPGSGK